MKRYFEMIAMFAEMGIDAEASAKFAWYISRSTMCIELFILFIEFILIFLLIGKIMNEGEKRNLSDKTVMPIGVAIVILLAVLIGYVTVIVMDWAQTEMIEWVIGHKVE